MWRGENVLGGKDLASSSSKERMSPSCRVCGCIFASFDDLKAHIRKEGHHSNTKDNLGIATGRGVSVSSTRPQKNSENSSVSGILNHFDVTKVQRRSKHGTGMPAVQSSGPSKEIKKSSLRKEVNMKKNLIAKMSRGG